jgi:hypothetical protein
MQTPVSATVPSLGRTARLRLFSQRQIETNLPHRHARTPATRPLHQMVARQDPVTRYTFRLQCLILRTVPIRRRRCPWRVGGLRFTGQRAVTVLPQVEAWKTGRV